MSTTADPSGTEWVKSSYSNGDGGGCVEWAPKTAAASGTVPVRDSKNPHASALVFESAAWSSFVAAVQRDEFITR